MKADGRLRLAGAAAALLLALVWLAAGCAPAAAPQAAEAPPAAAEQEVLPSEQPTQPPAPTPARDILEEEPAPAEAPAAAPMPTAAPTTGITAAPTATLQGTPPHAGAPAATPEPELRVVELEWPESLRLGESDVIRLSLIPSEDGYTASAEFDEHTVASQEVEVPRPEGSTLRAAARLDGPAFEVSPAGEQVYIVNPGETVSWRWSLSPRSPGRQRVSLVLLLRWEPRTGVEGEARESIAFDRSLEIRVRSFLGLGKPEAAAFGYAGLVLSGVLGVWAWGRPAGKRLLVRSPNRGLAVEPAPGTVFRPEELKLVQAVFSRYRRVLLTHEFLSGYSGARTFLARPVLPGGQADADTIIKIGPAHDIRAEYEHYEQYVKDRLPPITARIQSAPVTVRGSRWAALRYTCISEPGRPPVSLRQALLAEPDPALLRKLFESFGPYWWRQRRPHTFRMAEEYDRLLPPHLVLEPAAANAGRPVFTIRPSAGLPPVQVRTGQVVSLGKFEDYETRSDGRSLTLLGSPRPGEGRLRLRWLSPIPPGGGAAARVAALRGDLFRQYTAGMDLHGLPDPLGELDACLQETIAGTRSIIHGDLNLENILVGPGSLVWLIDFAGTREGHPLFDFAHLASEVIGHILVRRYAGTADYLAALRSGSDPLLGQLEEIASECQFNARDPREYRLALKLACLGALKYQNLPQKARHFLYLMAAFTGE